MKSKIIYTIVFTSAFVLVTSIIIVLNAQYKNIFKFDFKPAIQATNQVAPVNKIISENDRKKIMEELKEELLDSIKITSNKNATDIRMEVSNQDTLIFKDIKSLKAKLDEVIAMNEKIKNEKEQIDTIGTNNEEIDLKSWAKKTAKLFESMDSKKVAKIITKYSDNESREVLYTMNRKKAAEILAELNPEYAKKLTRPL